MNTENFIDGSTFCLSTGGNPLKVTISTPENKSKRISFQQLSFEKNQAIKNCVRTIKKQNKKDDATLRKGLGSKLSIEPNIFGCLYELEGYISNYYNVQKCEFVDSDKQIILLDILWAFWEKSLFMV